MAGPDGGGGKAGGMLGTIVAALIGTALAAGVGFTLGNMMGDATVTVAGEKQKEAEKAAEEGAAPAAEEAKGKTARTGVEAVQLLEPVTVTLRGAQKNWIRLELAIVTDSRSMLDEQEKLYLQEAMLGSLRENTLEDVVGPSGFLHLREDLGDIAALATDRKVHKVLIRSLIVE